MNIKKVSEITGLSIHTLRYYEKIGLLIDVKRTDAGHRYYLEVDIKWIEFVKRLKETGMPLSEMRRFALLRHTGNSTIGERRQLLETHKQKMEAKIEDLQINLQNIVFKIDHYKNMEVEGKKS